MSRRRGRRRGRRVRQNGSPVSSNLQVEESVLEPMTEEERKLEEFDRLGNEGAELLIRVIALAARGKSPWEILRVIDRNDDFKKIAYALAIVFHGYDGQSLQQQKWNGYQALRCIVRTQIAYAREDGIELPPELLGLEQRFAHRASARTTSQPTEAMTK